MSTCLPHLCSFPMPLTTTIDIPSSASKLLLYFGDIVLVLLVLDAVHNDIESSLLCQQPEFIFCRVRGTACCIARCHCLLTHIDPTFRLDAQARPDSRGNVKYLLWHISTASQPWYDAAPVLHVPKPLFRPFVNSLATPE